MQKILFIPRSKFIIWHILNKNIIDSVLANNAITDKSSKISQYIELMEDSSNKYENYFLTVMDSDGDTHWVLIVELFLSEN